MPSIDQRIVQMTFDNKQFEQGVSQSTKSLETLKKSLDLDKSAQSLANLEKVAKGFNLSGISEGIENISNKFTMLGMLGVTAMQRVANAAIDAGIRMAKSISIDQISAGQSKYETETKAVQTITNATGKSVEEVEKILKKLMHYTDETSYDFSAMVSSIGKFTSAGVDLEVAEKAMEGIANEAAKSGAGIQEANRAMYNFAQALSSGYVRKIDWMSISNANMGTKEFKETLIQTALEMGTLKKQGDKVVSTMKTAKDSSKQADVNFKTFDDTLQDLWLTSDVLVKTLEKYSDTTTPFGQSAYEAAQKALTFTDAINAVKDAVSSGWSRTFKALFGNLNEAMDLWTRVANSLYDFVAIFFEARNELLEGWHELGGYNKAVEAASNIWHTFMNVVYMVKDALESVFPPITSKRLVEITDRIKEVSEAIRKRFSYEQFEEVEEHYNEIVDYAKELDVILKRGARSAEVKTLQERLMHAGYALDKHGADGIFGPETENAVKKLQKALGVDVTGVWDEATRNAAIAKEAFIELEDHVRTVEQPIEKTSQRMRYLQDIIKGIASGISIVKSYVNTGIKIVGHFFSLFKPLEKPILRLLAMFGKFTDNERQMLEETNRFGKIFRKAKTWMRPLGDEIEKIARSISKFITKFNRWAKNNDKYNLAGFFEFLAKKIKATKLGKVIFGVIEKVQPAVDKLVEFFGVIKKAVVGFFTADTGGASSFIDKLKERLKSLTEIWDWIKENVGKLFNPGDTENAENSVDFFTQIGEGFKKVVEFIKGINISQILLFGIAIISAIKLYKKIKAPLEVIENVAKIPKAVSKYINARNNREWLENIGEFARNLGIGVALLAASIFALAQLDTDKALVAAGMVAALMAMMVGTAFVMKKLKLDGVSTKGYLKFTIAVLILASSVEKLGKLPFDSMMGGILGLTIIIGEMIAFSKLMKESKLQVGGLTDMGAGISMITSAVEKIGKMKPDQIAKGLAGVGTILVEIGIFMRLANAKELKTGPLAMIGLGAAVLMLATSLKMIAKLKWDAIGRGLVGLGAVMLELAAFMRLTSGFGSGQRLLGLVGIGVSVLLLAKSLSMLSKLDTKGMLRGLIGLGAVMLEMAIFMKIIGGRSAAKQIGLAMAMVGIGTAVMLIASSLKSLAKLKTDAMLKGIIGLGAVMIEIAAFMKLIGARNPLRMMGDALAMIGLGAALGLFVLSIAGLSMLNADGLVRGITALGAVLVELAVFLKLANGMEVGLKSMPVLIAMAGAMLIFSLSLAALGDVSWDKIIAFGVSFGIVMGSISSTIAILSHIPISGGIAAVANLDIFIANLLLVLGAIGGLQELTNGGLGDWLEKGAQALGQAIGGFIKGIVSPFIDNKKTVGAGRKDTHSLTDYLNDFIGEMSNVMDNMAPFLEKVKSIDEDSVNGMKNLASVLLSMTSTELLDTMANWIVNDESGSAFVAFAKDLVTLMPLLKQASDAASGISVDNVASMATAMEMFGGIAKATIPMTAAEVIGAIGSFISVAVGGSGESSFVAFARDMVELVPHIKQFSDIASGINVTAVENAASAMEAFGKIASATVNIAVANIIDAIAKFISAKTGGSGESSFVSFAKDLIDLVPEIINFSDKAKNIKKKNIENAADALSAFATVCNAAKDVAWDSFITNILSFIGGDSQVIAFADQMITLAPKLVSFGNKVNGVDNKAIRASAKSLSALAKVAEEVPEAGGLIQSIFGEHDIEGFGTKLESLGSGIYQFYNETKSIPADYSAEGFASSLSALVRVAKDIPGAGGFIQAIIGDKDLGSFGEKLKPLGQGLADFADATKGIPEDYKATGPIAALSALSELESGLTAHGGISQWFSGDKDLGLFGEKLAGVGTNLKTFSDTTAAVQAGKMQQIGIGLQELATAMTMIPDTYVIDENFNALQHMVDLLGSSIDYTGIETMGETAMENFAKGIKSNNLNPDPISEVKTILDNMHSAGEGYYDKFYAIGKFMDSGLVNGLEDGSGRVYRMARRVARQAYEAARQELEVASPSKKGAWLGEMFDVGLAEGLKSYEDRVGDSARKASESAVENALYGIREFNDVVASDLDEDISIRPVLDLSQVRDGSSELSGIFGKNPKDSMSVYATVSADKARDLSVRGIQNEMGLVRTSMDKSDSNFEKIFSDFSDKFDRLEEDMRNLKVVLNDGTLVGSILSKVDRGLGKKRFIDARSR